MQTINAWQFTVVVLASYLGFGIYQYPRELVTFGGADAGWALIALSVVFWGILMLWFQVAHATRNQSLNQLWTETFSPWGAALLQIPRVMFHVAIGIAAVADFGQVMHAFFLPSTPVWAVQGALLATALYAAWYGVAVIARSLEPLVVLGFFASGLIGLLVVHEYRLTWAIWPSSHIAVMPTLAAAYHSAYVFFSFDVMTDLYSTVRPDQQKVTSRYIHVSLIAGVVAFVFGYVNIMATEGPYATMFLMQWPPVSALRLADMRGFFISKLGLLVVVLWGLFTLALLASHLWYIAHDLAWRGRFELAGSRYHWILGGATVLVFAGAQFVPNVVILVHWFQTYGLPFGLLYLIAMPPFTLLGYAIRKRLAPARSYPSHPSPS